MADPTPSATRPHGTPPVLVEVTRGELIESRHRGHAAVVDADARVIARWGDVDPVIFARSAIKPVQALALVETGALDAFGLGDVELALACASHTGEPRHTEVVARWLDRIGCTDTDLGCGATLPSDPDAAARYRLFGPEPRPLHHNCSGKHLGMLTTARHTGAPVEGYLDPTHPVQQRLLGLFEQITGHDLSRAPRGRDGCSVPLFGLPVGAIALAMARLADPARHLPPARAAAAARVCRAWGGYPEMIGGVGVFDSAIIPATQGRALVKRGAEGVGAAALPELGLGLAVKIEDGGDRARDVAVAALLRYLGVIDDAVATARPDLVAPAIVNPAGLTTGMIRPAPGFAV